MIFLSLVFKSIAPQRDLKYELYCNIAKGETDWNNDVVIITLD
jgi:hypothetical protein